MIKNKKIVKKKSSYSERLIDKLVLLEADLNQLPELSTLARTRLEQDRAIEHLYYSSKLEGTRLTQTRINRAIYGQEFSAA